MPPGPGLRQAEGGTLRARLPQGLTGVAVGPPAARLAQPKVTHSQQLAIEVQQRRSIPPPGGYIGGLQELLQGSASPPPGRLTALPTPSQAHAWQILTGQQQALPLTGRHRFQGIPAAVRQLAAGAGCQGDGKRRRGRPAPRGLQARQQVYRVPVALKNKGAAMQPRPGLLTRCLQLPPEFLQRHPVRRRQSSHLQPATQACLGQIRRQCQQLRQGKSRVFQLEGFGICVAT